MDEKNPILDEILRGGAMRSLVVRRGTALRLTDTEGGGNVAALFFNAAAPLEPHYKCKAVAAVPSRPHHETERSPAIPSDTAP